MGLLSDLPAQYPFQTPTLLGGYGLGTLQGLARPWLYVQRRFQGFLTNIEPTQSQQEDVFTKASGIITALNNHYWGGPLPDGQISFLIVGSWGKNTRVRIVSDMDMLFFLPWAVYSRFQSRSGNKQSALLQEVKTALQATYPQSDIRSDGPTIILDFSTYKVEVAPSFIEKTSPTNICDPGFKVLLCDTNNNGKYKLAAPVAERNKLETLNRASGGDLIPLIRMAKIWKRYCSAPIKSFYLEQLAMEFVSRWPYIGKGFFWYDWMIRDYFAYILTRQNCYNTLPVSYESFHYGNAWVSRAETAFRNATAACLLEQYNQNRPAGEEWQKIFGDSIPREVL
jgi:hypothetical protein